MGVRSAVEFLELAFIQPAGLLSIDLARWAYLFITAIRMINSGSWISTLSYLVVFSCTAYYSNREFELSLCSASRLADVTDDDS